MRRRCWILAGLLALAGCATRAPPLPPLHDTAGDRVGVLVELPETPLHTHIGTTVFNNFEKNYPYRWQLAADLRTAIERELAHAGFEPVDLAAAGVSATQLQGLVEVRDGAWALGTDTAAFARDLARDRKLKAVVLVRDEAVMAMMQCSGGPCSFFTARAPGLFTRSFLGLNTYLAVAALHWNAYHLDPPADLAAVGPLAERLRRPVTRLSDYQPAELGSLTEADFVPVHDAIVQFAAGIASELAAELHGP
jgi:hypothetical protein